MHATLAAGTFGGYGAQRMYRPLILWTITTALFSTVTAAKPSATDASSAAAASTDATVDEGVALTVVPRSVLTNALLGRRVSIGAGAYSTSYGFFGGSWTNGFATQQAEARWLSGGFTLEGGVQHALPVGATAAAQAVTGHLRLGWTFSRATVTAGAVAQWAPTVRPSIQLVPSVTAAWAFDRFGISGGLFDVHGLALARISYEREHFGVGYVAPLGAEAHGRIHLSRSFSLHIQGMAFRAFNAQVLYFSASGVFDADRAAAGGAS